ncbi:MAG: NAD(P)-binding protein, partial [Spirochaetaceae bacterium]|nr:NAD(P)-binding protein [Spirochaetaceae bacterium]
EYLIAAKGFDAYVKLNPTLLGYDAVRDILDATGWKSLRMERSSFEKDLQFPRALDLVRTLGATATAAGRRFGVKLSNTLANRNDGSYLPGAERYMSGRALFPVTVRLAAELAEALPEFPERFSYCGGASALNVADLVAAGLGPITIATDILKPGGYLRLGQAAREAAGAIAGSPDRPDAATLRRLAVAALERPEYRSGWKAGAASIKGPLPVTDCFAAPCIEACPVGQRVPEYLRLSARGGDGRREALASILSDNPLPFITGTLCDHDCQVACCRNDYEGSVEIRAVKLHCAKSASVPASRPSRAGSKPPRAAAVGAGPAGLAFAHHMALAGLPVTVFDSSLSPGGVPANVIPRFRIPRADIAADIERIAALGVEFRFGTPVAGLDELASQGFASVFACVGASVPREMPLEGSGVRIVDALSFLSETAGLGSEDSAEH